MAKNTICLWYDHDAEAAARFYADTFPESSVGAIHRAPAEYPDGIYHYHVTDADPYINGAGFYGTPGTLNR